MPTYQDALGQTQNLNPGVLDGSGSISMFLTGPTDIYVYDPNGNLVESQYNVSASPAVQSTSPQWVNQSTAITYINTTSFSVPGNQTATFSVGTRIQASISGGSIYGTIESSSSVGTPVITTVTVTWDSTVLNNSVTAVLLGIVAGGQPSSLPIPPVVPHTVANATPYQILITDGFQIHDFLPTSGSPTIGGTLPAANGIPSGWQTTIKNLGTPVMTLIGTLDGFSGATAVTLGQYQWANVFSDGTALWRH